MKSRFLIRVLAPKPVSYSCIHTSAITLAPKAKTKGGASQSTSAEKGQVPEQHIFNIYNNKDDHIVLPDSAYPTWLWSLNRQQKTYGELSLMFVHGEGVERATFQEYKRFRKLHNRVVIKLNNLRSKRSRTKMHKTLFDI